jgi:hypothetical protein
MNEILEQLKTIISSFLTTSYPAVKYSITIYDEIEITDKDNYYFLLSYDRGGYRKMTTKGIQFSGTISMSISKYSTSFSGFMTGMTWISPLIQEILSKVFTQEIVVENLIQDTDNDVCAIEYSFTVGGA